MFWIVKSPCGRASRSPSVSLQKGPDLADDHGANLCGWNGDRRGTDMTVVHLNRWYDGLPETWRFQVVLLPLLVLGAINMALTVSLHFPFGLLVMLAVLALAIIRAPYLLGWIESTPVEAAAEPAGLKHSIAAWPWVYDVNLWYDGLPETRQPWVFVVVLVVAGGLNMLLTIHGGFPFGLLFLLALLAIIAIRAPYEAGWLTPPAAPMAPIVVAPPAPEPIAQDTTPHIEPLPIMIAEPAPVVHDVPPEPDKPA
jgi:hypothetical protein